MVVASRRPALGFLPGRLHQEVSPQPAQQRVDGALADFESSRGSIDRGRLDLDPEPLGFGAKFRQLIGVVEVERHRGGEEFDRVVRLHIGGLVRH